VDATGVKVNYSLPSSLEFLASPDDYDPASGVWDIGNLPWGTVASMEIAAKAQKAGGAVNTATIMGNEVDPNTENNTASLTIQVWSSGGSGGVMPPVNPPVPPVNPPIPPTPPNPNPPIPHIPPEPGPGPSNPPKTQLDRDIAGVRGAVSSGNTEENVPEWTGDPGPEFTQEEYEGWVKTMLKFSVEVAILAFMEFTPSGGSASGEYLQSVKNAFLNNFKALNTISSYFNKVMRTKQISDVLANANKIINNPTVQKALKTWDELLNKAGFNYGMEVFKRGMYKLFPGQEAKIDALLLAYSSAQFIQDPDGTINAVIDIITSLMKGQLPDRESFEKVFIFDPVQD
jgi:hypothetical protein